MTIITIIRDEASYIAQADLELLDSGDPPQPLSPGITGAYHCASH